MRAKAVERRKVRRTSLLHLLPTESHELGHLIRCPRRRSQDLDFLHPQSCQLSVLSQSSSFRKRTKSTSSYVVEVKLKSWDG